MKEFFRRHRTLLISLVAFVLFLELLSLGVKKPGELDFVSRFVIQTVGTVASLFDKSIESMNNVWRHYIALTELHQENDRLRKEVARLQGEKNALIESLIENERLKALLHFKERFPSPSVTARVIGTDPSTWSQTLWIDQGREGGIHNNAPVLSVEGVIGRIWEVEDKISQVLLITHPFSAVDGIIQRTRIQGMATGNLGRTLDVKYIPLNADVREGDILITSGLEGIFPKGLPIGTIETVKQGETGLFQEVTLRPAARLENLEEVLILLKD